MVYTISFNLLGIFLFLFLFWKRLKEDYSSDIVFSSSFYILAALGVFAGISFKFLPLWWFWFSLLGIALGLGISFFRFHLRTYETLEVTVLSFLPWLSLLFLSDSINSYSIISFVAFALCLVLIFIFYFLDMHYKNFSWYRSGKVGFTGLTVLGIFFLIRAALAIPFHTVLSFVGTAEVYISAVLSFICFVLVLNLSR
ncbi:hypothetical protein ACFL1Q_00430 [Patescibacteria group bacterium]